MEVCLYCKHYVLIRGMAGAAVCIKDRDKHEGDFIVSPEYHTCKEWREEDAK